MGNAIASPIVITILKVRSCIGISGTADYISQVIRRAGRMPVDGQDGSDRKTFRIC